MLEKSIDAAKVRREKGMVVRSRKWDSYVNGERGPGQIAGKRDSVAQAEAMYPGTAKWFHNPIWRALSSDPLTREECEELLSALEVDFLEIHGVISFDLEGDSFNKPIHRQNLVDMLVREGTFDAFAASVVLLRWGDAIYSTTLHSLARQAAVRIRPKICKLAEIEPFCDELLEFVADWCRSWSISPEGFRTDLSVMFDMKPDLVWDDVYPEASSKGETSEGKEYDGDDWG